MSTRKSGNGGPRSARFARKTTETNIEVALAIDGSGTSSIDSGNGFMDHMLTLFARHGLFDLTLTCKGDTEVDFHHSAEDIGICLGRVINEAAGGRKGIVRYGTSHVPMDESLARVSVDIGGRPNLVYQVDLVDRTIGNFDCDLAEDFFKALTDNALITLHVDLIRGRNSHHSLEAVFKATARALSEALRIDPRSDGSVPSTKGVI